MTSRIVRRIHRRLNAEASEKYREALDKSSRTSGQFDTLFSPAVFLIASINQMVTDFVVQLPARRGRCDGHKILGARPNLRAKYRRENHWRAITHAVLRDLLQGSRIQSASPSNLLDIVVR